MTRNLEKTARAMSVSYLQILFAALWGFLFLSEIPNVLCILGALLVIAGTIVATGSIKTLLRIESRPGNLAASQGPSVP